MTKNNSNRYVIITLVVITTLLVAWSFIGRSITSNQIALFSRDKIIEPTTSDTTVQTITSFLVLLFLLNSILIVLFRIDMKIVKTKLNTIVNTIKIERFLKIMHNVKFVHLMILILFLYFVAMCLVLIFNNDVGADEGLYISCVKYFYETGKFSLPWRDFAHIALQLVYYPFFILKHIISFSRYSLRFISLAYSLLFSVLLFSIFKNKYSLVGYALLLSLLFFDRSYVYVSSSGFGETSTCLAIFLGIFLLSNKKHGILLPALLLALAGLTKLQLLPITIFLLIIYSIFQESNRNEYVMVIFFTCLFWVIGAFGFSYVQGYDFVSIARGFWYLLTSSSQMAYTLPLLNRLSHVNNFYTAFNIVIFSSVTFYYVIKFRNVDAFEKMLFIFSSIMCLWWIFCYPGVHVRNLFYVVVIQYFLFVIVLLRSIKTLDRGVKNIFLGAIALFCVLNAVNTTIFNIKSAKKGFSDEFALAIIGYETSVMREITSAQDEFFTFVNEKISPESEIYYVSVDYYKYIFTDREFIPLEKGTGNLTLPKNSYFLITYIDYKCEFVWDELLVYLNNHAELIFKKNFYEIYRVVK